MASKETCRRGSRSTFYKRCVEECASRRAIVPIGAEGLNRTLSNEISWLRELRVLDLHDNQLNGTVPVAISLLQNLRNLSLQLNGLSGRVPMEIGELVERTPRSSVWSTHTLTHARACAHARNHDKR